MQCAEKTCQHRSLITRSFIYLRWHSLLSLTQELKCVAKVEQQQLSYRPVVSSRERLTRGKAFSELLCRSLLVSPNRDTYLPANTVKISRLLAVKRWTSTWYIAHNLAFHIWRSYLSPSLPTVTIFSYCIDDSGKHWELGKSADFIGKTYRFWRSKTSIISPI